MMRWGEIPTNMWSALWSRCRESQKIVPKLQQEQTDTNAELKMVNEQIEQLLQKKQDLEQRLREVQQTLSSTIVSPQVLDVVETLSNAEQNEQKQLEARLKEEKENTMLSIEEIGYFLNTTGIPGGTQKLISLAKQENNLTEMSLSDVYPFLYDSFDMASKLEIRFAIDMVRHDQYPYDKHQKECPVCRNSVTELLTEYQMSLKESEVAKISSSGLMYLESAEVVQLLNANTNMERLQSMKAINKMRQNHINFITEQL